MKFNYDELLEENYGVSDIKDESALKFYNKYKYVVCPECGNKLKVKKSNLTEETKQVFGRDLVYDGVGMEIKTTKRELFSVVCADDNCEYDSPYYQQAELERIINKEDTKDEIEKLHKDAVLMVDEATKRIEDE